jgi:methionyl-tRNA formyltransferase
MSTGVDAGDIIHQKQLDIRPDDTGDTLYKRALALEYDVFVEAWPALRSYTYTRTPQDEAIATNHKRADLDASGIRRIDLSATVRAGDLLTKLRALTTNRQEEAAYFEADGRRYLIRVTVTPDPSGTDPVGLL